MQLRAGESQGETSWGVGVNFHPYLSIDAAQYSEQLGTDTQPLVEKRTVLEIKIGF